MSKLPIIITYEPSSNTLSVNGVAGKSCTDITKEIEKNLGEVISMEKTSEFYEKPTQSKESVSNHG